MNSVNKNYHCQKQDFFHVVEFMSADFSLPIAKMNLAFKVF